MGVLNSWLKKTGMGAYTEKPLVRITPIPIGSSKMEGRRLHGECVYSREYGNSTTLMKQNMQRYEHQSSRTNANLNVLRSKEKLPVQV